MAIVYCGNKRENTFNLDALAEHNKLEHDLSLVHADFPLRRDVDGKLCAPVKVDKNKLDILLQYKPETDFLSQRDFERAREEIFTNEQLLLRDLSEAEVRCPFDTQLKEGLLSKLGISEKDRVFRPKAKLDEIIRITNNHAIQYERLTTGETELLYRVFSENLKAEEFQRPAFKARYSHINKSFLKKFFGDGKLPGWWSYNSEELGREKEKEIELKRIRVSPEEFRRVAEGVLRGTRSPEELGKLVFWAEEGVEKPCDIHSPNYNITDDRVVMNRDGTYKYIPPPDS